MLDRKHAPPFVKSTSFQLPQTSKIILPNGIRLFHLDNIQQELVKIEVVFNAGKWFESKSEVSHFAVHMLDKGTKSMSSKQIAELFDFYGAHIELSSNLDFASASLYTLTRHLSKIYPIFLELITFPSFNKKELDLLKEQFIQGLRVKNEKTSYLASKLIRRNIFGISHPYGQSAEELDVKEIKVSDLTSFFHNKMKPSNVFVLGKINSIDFTTLKNSISAIDIGELPTPAFIPHEGENKKDYIKKDSSVQSSIRLGKRTLQRDHTDYPGILILTHYLGGYFGSRLMKNLREEKGLTYGISSSINSLKNDSIILIGTDVNKENRELAINEIINEIRLLTSFIDAEELELAKRHFIGSLQGEIASPFAILGKVKNIELHQLPDTYYQNLIQKIVSATADDLSLLANTYLNPDSFFEVSVG